jgi:hypothetical protein
VDDFAKRGLSVSCSAFSGTEFLNLVFNPPDAPDEQTFK